MMIIIIIIIIIIIVVVIIIIIFIYCICLFALPSDFLMFVACKWYHTLPWADCFSASHSSTSSSSESSSSSKSSKRASQLGKTEPPSDFSDLHLCASCLWQMESLFNRMGGNVPMLGPKIIQKSISCSIATRKPKGCPTCWWSQGVLSTIRLGFASLRDLPC